QFIEHVEKSHSKLDQFFKDWLENGRAERSENGAAWSVLSYEKEPERTLIVYGTLKESAAQQEAAERLQKQVVRRWANITVPIKADKEVTHEDLKNHHLLLIGRPDSNSVAAKCAASVPATFGSASFVLRGKTYAHSGSALIAAGDNPLNHR